MAASYLSFSTTSTSSFTNAARHVSALSSKLLGVRFSATSAGVMSTSDRSSSTAANRRWESTSRIFMLAQNSCIEENPRQDS
uniref:Uncharacterized protein n=1 Tax=Oryza glumipatula TaxID=40148 RepID=A0A0D9ZEL0_9ORYZ